MQPIIFDRHISEISIDSISEAFNSSGLVVLRNSKVDEHNQKEISVMLGDIYNWTPCSRQKTFYIYKEDHSLTFNEKMSNQPTGEELFDKNIFVNWHLEHVHRRPMYVGALWLMVKFLCNKDSGMTGFVDACEIVEHIDSSEIEFLEHSEIIYSESNLLYDAVQRNIGSTVMNCVPAIEINKNNGAKMLRITPAFNGEHLYRFDDQRPSVHDLNKFNSIKMKVCRLIWTSKNLQFWWKWQVGDLLIVDLSRMYHAVSGGFVIGERELVGIHCIENDKLFCEW